MAIDPTVFAFLALIVPLLLAAILTALMGVRAEIATLNRTLHEAARRRAQQRQKVAEGAAKIWEHHAGTNGTPEKP